MSEKAPRMVTSQMLLDSLPPFGHLATHCLGEMPEAELREVEQEAHEIAEGFFKVGDGKRNGSMVVAALFVIFKLIEKYRRDAAGIKEHGSTLVQ